MQGDLRAESRPGRTTFTLEFPGEAARQLAAALLCALIAGVLRARPPGRGRRAARPPDADGRAHDARRGRQAGRPRGRLRSRGHLPPRRGGRRDDPQHRRRGGDGGGARPGLGLRAQRRGEIATNAHVVTTGRGRRHPPRGVGLRPLPRRQPGAGARSSASTPSPTSPCCASTRAGCAAAAAARLHGGPRRRRAGRRDRQPVRRGAVAVDRRHLGAGPLDRVPDRLQHDRRHPDRRGDQPRQLRRPAARRARPRARHQRADPHRDAAPARAWASPCRSTPCAARWTSCAATAGVRYGYLGVTTAPVYPQLAERFGLGVDSGAWVQDVAQDGPADDAGLRAGRRPRAPSSTGPTSTAATSSRP